MRTLTISLMDSADAIRDMRDSFIRAWNTGEYQGETLSYATPMQLFNIFTQKRWEMIACLQKQQTPVSIRELARQLGRDVHRVHDDVKVLLAEGVLEQDATGVSIPYAEIHTDFILRKAA